MRRLDQLHLEHPFMGARMLRKLAATRANQVWALDTTYISHGPRFVYLTAVVDVAARRVLAHRVAITPEAIHAKEVIEQAIARNRRSRWTGMTGHVKRCTVHASLAAGINFLN